MMVGGSALGRLTAGKTGRTRVMVGASALGELTAVKTGRASGIVSGSALGGLAGSKTGRSSVMVGGSGGLSGCPCRQDRASRECQGDSEKNCSAHEVVLADQL